MTKICGIAGSKQAGKSSCFNYLLGMEMLRLGIIRNKFFIDDKGQLNISDIFGDVSFEGVFDPNRRNQGMKDFLRENVSPFIKQYSFADKLKEACIELFGFKDEWCYGTDEQKNTITHIKWDDIPGVLSKDFEDKYGNVGSIEYGFKVKSGYMTAREFMQHFGSNVMRRIYEPIWINATINQIKKDEPMLAVIVDVRFPNEVKAIKEQNGLVIRLTRSPFPDDKHESEIALDKDVYDWKNFDYILDNSDMSVDEKNIALQKYLESTDNVDRLEYVS